LITIIVISSLAFLLFRARDNVLATLALQEARFALLATVLKTSAPEKPESGQDLSSVSYLVVPLSGTTTIVVKPERGVFDGVVSDSVFERLGIKRPSSIDTRGHFVIADGKLFVSTITSTGALMISAPLGSVTDGLLYRMTTDFIAVAIMGFLLILIRESRLSDYSVRRLLDASPVPLFVIDVEGAAQFANQPALELFCGSRQSELERFEAGLKCHSQIFAWLIAFDGQIDEAAAREFAMDAERSCKRHVIVSRHSLVVRSRRVIVGSVADITVRHEAERALLEAKNAAETLDRMKSESLAMISHELKTPVSGVLGMAELLAAQPLSGQASRIVRRITQVAGTLAVIINDIVDLAVMETGHLRIDQRPFDLLETVNASVALASAAASEKGLAVRVYFEQARPPRLVGDVARLQQIIINLVANGIKFTEAGEICVRVGLTERSAENVELKIEVTDTGIGIAEDVIPRLFQPFSQGDIGNRRRYGGTGLGLAICKRLLDAMGGDISLRSTLGSGSTFVVRLPLARYSELASDVPEPLGLRALVVDDLPLNVDIVSELLRLRGCGVHGTQKAETALEILRDHVFDFVLMDIRMPGMDGLTAASVIRGDEGLLGNAGQIIGLTANLLVTDRPLYALRGFDSVIEKPVDVERLREEVRDRAGAVAMIIAEPERARHLRSSLDEARSARIFEAFNDVATGAAETIAACCARLDLNGVREAAHRMAGAASNVGLDALSSKAAELEDAAQEEAPARVAEIALEAVLQFNATLVLRRSWAKAASNSTGQQVSDPMDRGDKRRVGRVDL